MKTIVSEETINGINAGKEKAFAVLYDCYFSYLCAYATTYVFDEEDAKDVVNELFASLWNQRGHLGWPYTTIWCERAKPLPQLPACFAHTRTGA